MTLTVRLDDTLEAALERHCAATGATKSVVVQESLARYLLGDQALGASRRAAGARAPAAPSANHRAFADAGLVGAGVLGGGSADKATVRALAAKRIGRHR